MMKNNSSGMRRNFVEVSMVKKLVMGAFVWFAAVAFSAHAETQQNEDPYQLLQDVATITFDRIKASQVEIKQDPEVLRTIMEEELLPYVDYQFAAFMVLGKHFRSVPKDKLAEYVSVFREYLITKYAVAMGYYDNQIVEFQPKGEYKDKKTVTVRAVVKDPSRPEIKIAFKVRRDKKTKTWKAYDMVAEGISLLSSQRSEFESILRQDGVDKVIAIMQEQIQQPIKLQPLNGEDAE